MSDLRNWLEMHNLGALTDLLTENEVDLEILPELGDSDLANIGLALGPRKKLLKVIRTLVIFSKSFFDFLFCHLSFPDFSAADSIN